MKGVMEITIDHRRIDAVLAFVRQINGELELELSYEREFALATKLYEFMDKYESYLEQLNKSYQQIAMEAISLDMKPIIFTKEVK